MAEVKQSNWEDECRQADVLYNTERLHRLEWAVRRARDCQGRPLRVKPYLGNWLTLIERATDRPDLHRVALDLIVALHRPVTGLGVFSTWEPHLRFGISVATRLGQISQQAELLDGLADVLYQAGRFDAAQNAADESLVVARTSGDAQVLVTGAGAVVSLLVNRGQNDRAVAVLDDIERDPIVRQAAGVARAKVMAHLCLLRAMAVRGQGKPGALAEAARLSDRAMRWLKHFPDADQHQYAHVCRNQGLYQWTLGHYDQAITLLRHAVRLFIQQGNPFDRYWAEGNLGLAYWSTGQLLKADHYTRRSAVAAKRLNARWQLTRQIGMLALIALFRGRLIEAKRHINRHCTMAEQCGVEREVARAIANRGLIELHSGHYDQALADLTYELAYLEQHPNVEMLGNTLCNLARAHAARGNLTEARRYVDRAVVIAREIDMVSLQIIVLRTQAECYSPNDCQAAISVLGRALELAETTGRKMDHAGCLFTLAHLTHDTELWDRGVAALCHMDATAWLRTGEQEWTIERPPRLPTVT